MTYQELYFEKITLLIVYIFKKKNNNPPPQSLFKDLQAEVLTIALWPLASDETLLSLSFLTFKMGIANLVLPDSKNSYKD